MKIMTTLVASAIALTSMAAPAGAFQIQYPQACQPNMSHIMYFSDGSTVVGAEINWCNGNTQFMGRPEVYSWTEWCDPCP